MLVVRDEQDAADIVEMVRSRQDLICLCPLYLLIIICEHSSRRNEKWRASLDLSLVQIENDIGLPGFTSSAPGARDGPAGYDKSYEIIIRDLHVLNRSLVWLSCVTDFELTMLQNATALIKLFGEMRLGYCLPWMTRSGEESLAMQIRYLESAAQMKQNQRHGLQQRAETQIGIVSELIHSMCNLLTPEFQLYSRISQRDDLLNRSIANSSLRIATVSQLDSRTVKTISILTLFFLPATLIAVSSPLWFVEYCCDDEIKRQTVDM